MDGAPAPDATPRENFLLAVSHFEFHEHKNFEGLVALFTRLAARDPDLRLVLTGRGGDLFEATLADVPPAIRVPHRTSRLCAENRTRHALPDDARLRLAVAVRGFRHALGGSRAARRAPDPVRSARARGTVRRQRLHRRCARSLHRHDRDLPRRTVSAPRKRRPCAAGRRRETVRARDPDRRGRRPSRPDVGLGGGPVAEVAAGAARPPCPSRHHHRRRRLRDRPVLGGAGAGARGRQPRVRRGRRANPTRPDITTPRRRSPR